MDVQLFQLLKGGKFGHGFISAGVTKYAAVNYISSISGAGLDRILGRTTIASIVGGTVSKLTGGKFANGAQTAATAHLFNSESKIIAQKGREHFMKHGVYPRVNGKRQSPSTLDKLVRGWKVMSGVDVSGETTQFMRDNPDFVNGVKLTVDAATVPFKLVRIASDSHVVIESSAAAYNGAYGDAAIGVISLVAGSGATHFLKGFNVNSDVVLDTSSLVTSKAAEAALQQDCFTCVK